MAAVLRQLADRAERPLARGDDEQDEDRQRADRDAGAAGRRSRNPPTIGSVIAATISGSFQAAIRCASVGGPSER